MEVRSPTELTASIDPGFGFGEALAVLQMGGTVCRNGWNAPGQYVEALILDRGGLAYLSQKMTQPYLYLKNAQDELVPWVPSQGDLFAEDWRLYV